MIWIYVASALFGGFFLVPMLLSGLDVGEADFDGGTDVDLGGDLDVDLEIEADVGGDLGGDGGTVVPADTGAGGFEVGDGPLGAIFASLVSFRTIVFFTAFFGTAGLVLTGLDYGAVLTAITSALIGGFAATANSVLFGLIRSSEASSQITDRTLRGRPAVVVLPMGDGHPGRVRVDLGGQPQYLVARPVDDGTDQRFDVGASVVVVDIENGTAMVTSLAELDLGEEN